MKNKIKFLINLLGFSVLIYTACNSETEPPKQSIFPAGRSLHSAAFDTQNNRLLVFGGGLGNAFSNELWAFDGTEWELLSNNGPSKREDAILLYHTANKKAYLIGGRDGSNTFQDFWEWDGMKWTLLSSSVPFGASVHKAGVYDAQNQRILIFGGVNPNLNADLWIWENNNWKKSIATGPAPRLAATMVYSRAAKKVYLFGGSTTNGVPFTDVWELTGETWTKVGDGMPKVLTGAHGVAESPSTGEFILFGGFNTNNNALFGETWKWDGKAWNIINGANPPARMNGTMIYDINKNRILLFGGFSNGAPAADLWEYGASGWKELK